MKYAWLLLFLSVPAWAEGPTYPNKSLTPGTTVQVELEDLCESGYTKTVRHVTTGMKKKVFKEYGIDWTQRAGYEVDHFINLGIGGNNDITNLWPMPYEPRPGAREKDVAEDYLRHMVCGYEMSLEDAQRLMREDWHKAYQMSKSGREKK
jgi:hypothetical protein